MFLCFFAKRRIQKAVFGLRGSCFPDRDVLSGEEKYSAHHGEFRRPLANHAVGGGGVGLGSGGWGIKPFVCEVARWGGASGLLAIEKAIAPMLLLINPRIIIKKKCSHCRQRRNNGRFEVALAAAHLKSPAFSLGAVCGRRDALLATTSELVIEMAGQI